MKTEGLICKIEEYLNRRFLTEKRAREIRLTDGSPGPANINESTTRTQEKMNKLIEEEVRSVMDRNS